MEQGVIGYALACCKASTDGLDDKGDNVVWDEERCVEVGG